MGRGRGRGGAWVAYDRQTQYGGSAGSPPAPVNLAATAVSAGAIDLTWQAGRGGRPVDEYAIERSPDGATYAEIGTTGGDATEYADTGLDAETAYTYRVRARNQAGYSAYCAPASAETEASGPAVLASATLETGDFSEFSSSSGGTTLTVAPAAAIDGDYGLLLDTDGSSGDDYAELDPPPGRPASGILTMEMRVRVLAVPTTLAEFFTVSTDDTERLRLGWDGAEWQLLARRRDGDATFLEAGVSLPGAGDPAATVRIVYDDTLPEREVRYYLDGALGATLVDPSASLTYDEATWWTLYPIVSGPTFAADSGRLTLHIDSITIYDGLQGT